MLIDELMAGQLTYRSAYHYPRSRMHLQKFRKNAADIQRVQPVHGQVLVS